MLNWYLQTGKDSDVVIASKITFARNLSHFNFYIKEDEKIQKLENLIKEKSLQLGYGLKFVKLSELDEITLQELIEKGLILDKVIQNKKQKSILLNDEENICIVINDEDHLQLQVFASGFELDAVTNLCIEIDKEKFELANIMNKYHALQFIILHNCFYLMNQKNQCNISSFYLSDVFACKSELGMFDDWLVSFSNPEVLRMIVEGECIPTKGYLKLYKQINMFAQKGYAEKITITKNDYDETYVWLKDILKVEPTQWIKPYKKIVMKQKEHFVGFDATMNCLMKKEEFKIDEDENYILNYLIHGRTGWFYSRIPSELDYLEQLEPLYESVLSSAGRSLRPWILKKIAILAYNSDNYENAKECGFIFEKFGANQNMLYSFPMVPEKLSALYYYSMFQEKHGCTIISKMLYSKLCQRFNMIINTKLTQYVPAILDLIKSTIEEKWQEYFKNIDIKNLVNFWADEFGTSGLSRSVKEGVKGIIIYRQVIKPFQLGDEQAYIKLLEKAEKLNSTEEVESIYKLLLFEMYYQEESIKYRTIMCINKWIKLHLLDENVYTILVIQNNSFDEEKFVSMLSKNTSYNIQEYQLICKLLSEIKCINQIKDKLDEFADTKEKKVILNLMLQLEERRNFCYFAIKSSNEFWLNFNYSDIKDKEFEKNIFHINKNPDGVLWPHTTEIASNSPLAMFIKPSVKGIYVSIEFCAVSCRAKHYLFELLSENYKVVEENEINRLKVIDIVVDTEHSYEDAIKIALNEFENIAVEIQEAYQKVKERISRNDKIEEYKPVIKK